MSGVPGSGKSTLARLLGDELGLPVLHRDRLREGFWRTAGERMWDRGEEVWAAFYATIDAWLAWGVSFVADATLYPGASEPEVARHVVAHARTVNIHTRTPLALERFRARMEADPRCDEAVLPELLDRVRDLEARIFEPLDLGCPSIVVDTTHGYDPPLDRLTERILETT
jgi:predicted kinase